MGKGLHGKRVAIGGSRKTEEISTIIEKQGEFLSFGLSKERCTWQRSRWSRSCANLWKKKPTG